MTIRKPPTAGGPPRNPGGLLPYDEALARVLGGLPRPRREEVPLGRAVGRVLARDARADRDIPPFDRATLDGYAVRVRGSFGDHHILPIVGEVAAGERPPRSLPPDACVRIATGAPVPAGAQGIIPVERAHEVEGQAFLQGPLEIRGTRRPAIADRGGDARRGDRLIERGGVVTLAEVAVLASIGLARVPVFTEPEVALIVTGQELVPPHERPGPVQVRSANGDIVCGLIGELGMHAPHEIGIVKDEREPLRRAIRRGLGHDVLVITGGISAGRFDLVPDLLRELGVRIRVHRVAIRPGKPFLFGLDTRQGRRTAVFGLPGNPVSVLVTAIEFLVPFLRAWRGDKGSGGGSLMVRIDDEISRGGSFLHFVPCTVRADREGILRAREVPFRGSGDFVSIARARAFLRVPGDGKARPAGSLLAADLLPGFVPGVEGA